MTYAELLLLPRSQLHLLGTFVNQQRTSVQSAAERAPYEADAQALYDAGLIWRFSTGTERDSSAVTWYTLEGFPSETAKAWISQLASERVVLSTAVLP